MQPTTSATGQLRCHWGINVAPFADPYATLAPPPVDCTNGTHSGSSGPGTYKTAASFSNLTLAPGIYIFCNGVSLGGSVTANGVLFYIVGGSFSTGSNADIVMSSPSTGPYGKAAGGANLTLWQAASDTNQMTVCCSNTASASVRRNGLRADRDGAVEERRHDAHAGCRV